MAHIKNDEPNEGPKQTTARQFRITVALNKKGTEPTASHHGEGHHNKTENFESCEPRGFSGQGIGDVSILENALSSKKMPLGNLFPEPKLFTV